MSPYSSGGSLHGAPIRHIQSDEQALTSRQIYAVLFGLLISNASAAVAEADSIKSSESIHNSPASLESMTPA